MKHRFRSLKRVRLLAAIAGAAACISMVARGQETGDAGQGGRQTGQQIVTDAAKRVASEPAISAELRYRIDAFGHALVGTGNYLQFGAGPEKLVRLDLRMQVGDKQATVQEIRGADTYWVRRDVPPAPPSLGRVDLKQLRKSLVQSAPPSGRAVLPEGEWIMLGGLSRLLTALDQNFAFAPPRADELQFNSADGQSLIRLPIWIVAGQWKAEKLAALTGRGPENPGAMPEQLPDRVELVLGRTEDIFPLFPYRITYWRSPEADPKASQHATPAAPRELLTLELFNVSRKPIDMREFQYQPGDQEVQNLTPSYVQRFTSPTKLR
jgi:hypothetical protein